MSDIGRKIRQNKHKQRAMDRANNTHTATQLDATQSKDRIEVSLFEANRMWCNLKDRLKVNPDFVNLPDEDKVVIYQTEFAEFYKEYPIVCRYMICMGQYSHKAMRRYLIKCKNSKPDKTKSQDKEYKADQWVMRRADYVRYLWESYQSQHFSVTDAQNTWQHAYQTLKKEFKDFNDMQQDVEAKLKLNNNTNKAQLVRELVKRLSDADNKQNLSEGDTKHLLELLNTKAREQRRKNMIMQIKNDVEVIAPTRISVGTRVVDATVQSSVLSQVREVLETAPSSGELNQLKDVLATAE
jgi:hypothetical protein